MFLHDTGKDGVVIVADNGSKTLPSKTKNQALAPQLWRFPPRSEDLD